MMDNIHNYKKPYMNQLFMNAGPGEGVKPNLTRPPITGNLTYMPKPAVMPNPHIGHVDMLGKKSAMAAINSPVEEQGRSPM